MNKPVMDMLTPEKAIRGYCAAFVRHVATLQAIIAASEAGK